MAKEEKKKTEAEINEGKARTQEAILGSRALQEIYATAANNLPPGSAQGQMDFGRDGARATLNNLYVPRMIEQADPEKKPDEYLARLQAAQVVHAHERAARAGMDGMRATYQPQDLFEAAIPFYSGGFNDARVGEVLKLINPKGKYKDLTDADKKMYLRDFAKANPDYYAAIVHEYFESVVELGTGKAILASGASHGNKLERILSQKKDAEEAQKKAEAEAAKKAGK